MNSLFRVAVAFATSVMLPTLAQACADDSGLMAQLTGMESTGADSMPYVEFDPQRRLLKVSAQGQPLDRVLAAINSAAGIEFHNQGPDCETVSIDFDFLPLEAALARVLDDRNHILTHARDKGTVSVWILPIGNIDRINEAEIMRDEFYKGLQGVKEMEELAEQLRRHEQQLAAHPD